MTGWSVGRGARGLVLPPDPWTTLLFQSFDTMNLADPVAPAAANAALGSTGAPNIYNAFAIVPKDGGKAWCWQSPANTYGNGNGNGVAGFLADPFSAYIAQHGIILEAAIEYDIEFPSDMDWSKGGKIPGLGGTATTANPPTGGVGPQSTGWSCRGMWLTPISGSFSGIHAKAPNEWIGYRYCISQIYPDYGQNIWSGASFVAGQTHNVRQEYKMNTVVGSTVIADGAHRLFFDGEKVFEDNAVIWRNRADLGVNRHLWHFFRGGNDVNYVGDIDNDIMLDNLKIQVATT